MDDLTYAEWSSAARRLGLKAVPRRSAFRGTVAGFPVELMREDGDGRLVVRVRLPEGFALSHETLRSRVGGLLGAGDFITGDPRFDSEIRVTVGTGDLQIRAALSSVARAEIRRLLEKGVRIGNDRLEYTTADAVTDSAIVAMIRDLADLARLLSVAPRQVPERLFDNTYDPEPDVRLRCLQALLDTFPDSGDCERGARSALSDSDVRIRRLGALAPQSGARGIETLLKMAADDRLALDDRLAALEGFLARATPERVIEELAERVAKGPGTLFASALVRALGNAGENALPSLERLQSDASLPASVRKAAARALARIHGKGAAGRVSLAISTTSGALSEPVAAGAVSVVPEPAPPRRKR